MDRQGQGAYPYARIFAILQISHELLTLGVTASQRDVYYRHVSSLADTHMCLRTGCTRAMLAGQNQGSFLVIAYRPQSRLRRSLL